MKFSNNELKLILLSLEIHKGVNYPHVIYPSYIDLLINKIRKELKIHEKA